MAERAVAPFHSALKPPDELAPRKRPAAVSTTPLSLRHSYNNLQLSSVCLISSTLYSGPRNGETGDPRSGIPLATRAAPTAVPALPGLAGTCTS